MEPDGLFDKYEVLKDGEPIDGPAFVLRPDRDRAARTALWAYANAVSHRDPTLAEDIREWTGDLSSQAAQEGDDG